jgi:HPt (histidine-containing phosphotransfer) domain-containing protein
VVSGLVARLETQLAEFPDGFNACLARGDISGAMRAAHTMQGSCRQLGAAALGDLFSAIESSVKAGDHPDAQRRINDGTGLIARSLDALKHA